MKLGLVERLNNTDFILESKMAELNQNKDSNIKTTTLNRSKTLFCFGKKSKAHSKQFSHLLQNRCSKNILKFLRKVSS